MLLACIALAVWRPGRYWPSVAIALLACLFRETAALFLLAFAACAAFERRWRETAAWCGAAVLLAAVCAVHLGVASHYSLPGDYTSPSWLRFGGWRFVITTARRSSLFASLPGEAISVAMTLCLLGMTQARGVWERRLMAATFAYVGLFLIAGRPDNYYWGILYAPLFPLGALYLIRLRSFMSFQLNRPAAGQTVS
jgi:hypothetical protein